jgi:hypothetical protein
MGPAPARRCLLCLGAREGEDGSSLRRATETGSPRSVPRPRSSTPRRGDPARRPGLHPFYEELVVRFGDAGVHALALDYYGRTAGTGSRGGDFDTSHTSNKRPMTTSVATWRPPWPTWANPTSTVCGADGCHGMCCSLPMWCCRRSPGAAAPFGLFLARYASVQARCGSVSGPVWVSVDLDFTSDRVERGSRAARTRKYR